MTRIPEKHYTVCTPTYEHYYGYYEPSESFADCATVIAPNKRKAKVEAVKALRKEGSDWFDDIDKSPFTGLEIFEAGCSHGNCWCDLCSALPDWSECEECMREWEDQCEHEWYTGPVSRSGKDAIEETYCNACMVNKEEFEARHDNRES